MSRYVVCRIFPSVCWVAAVLAAAPDAALAQSPAIDWKFYGGAKLTENAVCFYDAAGVTRESTAHIRVWTKCLRQKDLDSIDVKSEVGTAVTKAAARKVATGYVPPIAQVANLNADQRMDTTLYEVEADIADLQPHASIFYELNCTERMMRELSISIISSGKRGSNDKPTEWWYVPPEGNGATLLKLLCTLR